jgi:hypothetical protein
MTRALRSSVGVILLAATALGGRGNAATQPPAVTWLVFVDDLHLDFRNTGRLRNLARTVWKQLPIDGDEMALFSSGPSNVSVKPTLDRMLLDNEAKKLTGSALKPADIQAAPSDMEQRYRAGVAQTRVRELIATAGDLSNRRIALIYISNGYASGTPPDLGGSHIPVYALDPRFLEGDLNELRAEWPAYWAATRSSLRALAQSSGGFAQEENQSVAGALELVGQVMRR